MLHLYKTETHKSHLNIMYTAQTFIWIFYI